MIGAKKNDDDSESFADLIGETKPIARGPVRVDRPARDPKTRPVRNAATNASDFRWPNTKERRHAAAPGVNDATLFALGRGEPAFEEQIDLHGVRGNAAGPILARRIESARMRGLRCVIVIHGRGQRSEGGEAVLREALPNWLSKAPCAEHVLAFVPAPNRLGGEGATLVLLRPV